MNESLRVLMVEDSETDAKLIAKELRRACGSIEMTRVEEAPSLRAALKEERWDLVICDWSMPNFSASAALQIVSETGLDLPFIIVSGHVGEDAAVQAMRAGANDYVLKDNLARLAPAVEREMRDRQQRQAQRQSEAALERAQDQLRQVQKMDAIGSLAGGIAHDFNNLLSIILSYTEMLCENLKPGDPMRADLEQVLAAGVRAAALTRQLLAFGRRQVMQPRIVNLNDIVGGIEPMLRRLLGEDIELTVLPRASLGMALLDIGQVEQVIMNVAANARDAMPGGGKLTIETANVELDDEYASEHLGAKGGPHVLLAVTDTGVGMDRETVSRMFEPFFTTKDEGKGTGLGLAMVFGIVKQSGGNVWVYSEPGKGTSLKFYFPRTERVEGAEVRPSQPPPGRALRGDETILLVEDDERVRSVTRLILKRHGYHVLEAGSAGDALLLCELHHATIQLLITDVIMPRMGGKQLAERLRAMRSDIRVLYMSGYTDNSIVHHGILDSGIAFLEKPIQPELLARKVREVLDAPLRR
jgi:signal transduction histidine kinase